MAVHHLATLLTLLLAVVLFLVVIVFNIFSGVPEQSGGLFLNTVNNISDKYFLEITPAGWTFSIWGVIYTWNILWLIYALTTIFRKNGTDYVYVRPQVLSPMFYATFSLNLGLNIGWLILFDREYLLVSLFCLALIAFTLYICIFISHFNLYRNLHELSNFDVWAIRILVHNGLAIYAAWSSLATILNLSIVLRYVADVDQSTVTIVALAIVSVEVTAWFVIEQCTVLEKYLRYTITPYFVVIVFLIGCISKNWHLTRITSALASTLGVASVLLIARVALLLYRHFTQSVVSTTNIEKIGEAEFREEDDTDENLEVTTF
ncbi:uncharacterized protein LOC100368081 [Saccoglossus kowalevskii]|uniref:Uncharacterized protein LOC100368081 n=1 Tax=Saccoglossus kowalevskii TaxID=10224 RepID=A0ABM0GV26_SACKO|nr:PREDICTED: uncharacterized protein LOC100368081 [Saccoglossus kowalevskii]